MAKEQRLALKSADIQLKLEVQDIVVNADRDKMRSVLENLLSNAVKFTPPGGFVTMRAAETPDSFVIDFADTGPGIPAESRNKVFEPLYSTKTFGVGLGLPLVKKIIEQHKGQIEIESPQGMGVEFRLWLPIVETEPGAVS